MFLREVTLRTSGARSLPAVSDGRRRHSSRLKDARQGEPSTAASLDALEKDLARLYYLGKFDEYVARIAGVPGR